MARYPDSKVHGAHLGPVGPRWAPCWTHEPCYQSMYYEIMVSLYCYYEVHFSSSKHYTECIVWYYVLWGAIICNHTHNLLSTTLIFDMHNYRICQICWNCWILLPFISTTWSQFKTKLLDNNNKTRWNYKFDQVNYMWCTSLVLNKMNSLTNHLDCGHGFSSWQSKLLANDRSIVWLAENLFSHR